MADRGRDRAGRGDLRTSTPEEIGLKSSVVGGGIEIKQLRPLNRAQPWGVFFLNLPSAKLPVTLVRNILGKLAIKKRASAQQV